MTEQEKIQKEDSIVYREIEQLHLPSKIENLAKELMNQIDMPVVFEINYQGDRNFGRRHPVHHNQFWVQIKPQEEESEFERLVLCLLYMGVLERRRIVRLEVKEEYKSLIENLPNEKERNSRRKNVLGTIGGICSFAVSMEADFYLRKHGVATSKKVMEAKFNATIDSLKEYHALQKTKRMTINGIEPLYRWYAETATNNIADMSRTCWLNKRYQSRVIGEMRRIKPKRQAEKYIRQLNSMVDMLHNLEKEYRNNPDLDVASAIVERSYVILELQNMAYLRKDYYMQGKYTDKKGTERIRCAFVPENIERKAEIVDGLRYMNTALTYVQEYYDCAKNIQIPDPHISLVISEDIQAWANGNKKKGYHISITTGLLLKLKDEVEKADLNQFKLNDCVSLYSEENIRERIYRYALFYVTIHEYVHILHGDCDNPTIDCEEQKKREENADNGAKQLGKIILPFQYRSIYDDAMQEMQRRMMNYATDQLIYLIVQNWCIELIRAI